MIEERSPISRFEILGLHGDRNIRLDFDHPVKILIGENGSGKTTVLNALYYLLTGQWQRLRRFEFNSIRISFPERRSLTIDAADLGPPPGEPRDPPAIIDHLRSSLSTTEYRELARLTRSYPRSRTVAHPMVREASARTQIPRRVILDAMSFSHRSGTFGERSKKQTDRRRRLRERLGRIGELFPYEIIYFPTFRRIEEDLLNLGYVETDLDPGQQLIQFGMGDVEHRFDRITSEIHRSTTEWFSIVSGQIVTQLIDGVEPDASARATIEDPDAVRILLDRIGENISENHKTHILELITSGDTTLAKNKPLVNYIVNLMKIYDQTRDSDNAIKTFARVANGYLEDKEVVYDESKVDIRIINKRSGKFVRLDRLSSGEKQLLSILSRLYLDTSSKCAVLIDEPELSLSLEWQRKLLQDIVDSGQCVFLLAATHSPFIFENDLDACASGLEVKFLEEESESS